MIKQSREKFVPFGEVVEALRTVCGDGQTGTLYIFTDKGYGAFVAFLQGRIVGIHYRTKTGEQALPLIGEIETAKYFFKNSSLSEQALSRKPDQSLPANDEIFRVIGEGTGPVRGRVNGQPEKILVVEDSAISRKAIKLALAEKNYEVVEAKDGFEALGKLGEERPDLVLLDLILPKMDGYAVLAAMKKDSNYKHIPVIVLTSRDTLLDKLKGRMSGTDEYLTKPFQPDELLKKVEKHLNGKKCRAGYQD